MRFIISQGGVKREIEGTFEMCASHEDFAALAERLQRALRDDFNYGWIDIYEPPSGGAENAEPLPWKRDQ